MSSIPQGWIKQSDGTYSQPKKSEYAPDYFVRHRGEVVTTKRLRQNLKPLMNKLEADFLNNLLNNFDRCEIHVQAITFKLANGLRYTPDFVNLDLKKAWEVKGDWVDGDSFPKLKMAASVYPRMQWILVWRKNGQWNEQIILP